MRKLLLITALLLTSIAIQAQYKITASSGAMNIRGFVDTNFNYSSSAFSYGAWGDKIRFVGFGTQTYMFNASDIDTINSVASASLTIAQIIQRLDSAITPATIPTITNGTYTPTFTNTTNVTSSTASVCTYFRVGNTVTVSGQLNYRPSGTGAVVLGISLPIASHFSTIYQAGGAIGGLTSAGGEVGGFQANATSDVVEMRMIAVSPATRDMAFTFTYQVL